MPTDTPARQRRRFRPILTLTLALVAMVVGWVGVEVYFAYTARPNPKVDYMAQLRRHQESAQGDGPNAWDLIGKVAEAHALSLDEFESEGTPFDDIVAKSSSWLSPDPALIRNDAEYYADYFAMMESDGLSRSEAESLMAQARDIYAQWLRQWSSSKEWDDVLELRTINQVMPPEGKENDYSGVLLDRAIHTRKLCMSLRSRQMVARDEADWDTYVECHEVGLALGWSLAAQPLLVQRLISFAITRNAMNQVANDADAGMLPDQVIARIEAAHKRRPMPDRMYTVRGEQLFMMDSIQNLHDQRGRRILGGPHAMPEIDWIGMGATQPSSLHNMKSIFYPRHDSVARRVEAFFAELEEATKLPLWKQHEMYDSPDFLAMLLHSNSDDLLGSLKTVAAPEWYTLTHLNETSCRISLALARYRHANAKLPETLDQLVPDYLDSVPADPFSRTNEPLRYALKEWTTLEGNPGGEYILYSVGFDGLDNDGTPPPTMMFNALKPAFTGTDYILNDPDWR